MAQLSQSVYIESYDFCPHCGGQMYESFRVIVSGDGIIPDNETGNRYTDSIECDNCDFALIVRNGKTYKMC